MELPISFCESVCPLLGSEDFESLVQALSEEPSVSIRLNSRFKQGIREAKVSEAAIVPWASQAYYLRERPSFTFDPLFHAGCYYVQEASSMFVEQALKKYVQQPVVMLDLCAAPGGKSTHLLSLLPEGSLLVANEVMRNRAQILAENISKWGCPNVVVTHNDPADFMPLENIFDVMLTDVPCSGEGMFRKDEVAVSEWSPENVSVCWQRQRRILTDIWGSLKPGGLLIYSTCTYNTQENEENVAWICQELGAEVLSLDIPADWGITGNLAGKEFPVYRFLPHKTRGEGFFLAVLRKQGESEAAEYSCSLGAAKSSKNKKGKASADVIPKEVLLEAKQWIQHSEEFEWSVAGASVSAFPVSYRGLLPMLKQHLRVLISGLEVGEWKGKDLVPRHALALSQALQHTAFPRAELSYGQAIAYLRKEAVILSADVPRGFVLVTYHQIPLGFVKNIGNRANNLYPQEWRVRSGYLPGQEVNVLTF